MDIMSSKKYSLFIGRWQPWHPGHRWLIDQRLNEGKNVCVAIRDVEVDENQPWEATDIKLNVEIELQDLIEQGRVKVITIPDIESVNYGRGVGYEIIEHVPPTEVEQISATKIREQMRKDGKL
jgi:nicotinamide mononucleotide adenylyltransferase